MAAFTVQVAGNCTRPASRGTCRATAVKPRATGMSPERPARLWRAVRGAGVLPLLDGEGFVFAEKGGVFGEEGTDEVGKELVHLLGAAAGVEGGIQQGLKFGFRGLKEGIGGNAGKKIVG